MPTINLDKKVLEKLVGKKLSLEELKHKISMLGTDLDKIEGNKITVEIFPNRPDMLSEQGFARALSSFIGVKTGLRKYDIETPLKDYKVKIENSVNKIRPYTVCAIVKNLKFDDDKIKETIQIQEKLHVSHGRNRKKLAIGIYPLEKIALPITYTAKKPSEIKFRPLESNTEMTGLQILNRHSAGREYGFLLEGKELFPIFIDSNKKILSMPPIINSHETGKITQKTKEVFIECSGFDLASLNQCLNIITTTLIDMGGKAYQMILEYQTGKITTPNLTPEKWSLDLTYVNKMLGLKLSKNQIKKLLEKMGFGYEKDKVLVPAYRTDILHQIDIAEDIAIAYGYDNFIPEIPNISTIGQENPLEILKSKVANILVGLGLIETISYHLTNKEEHNNKMLNKKEVVVEIEKSKSSDYNILRSKISPSLIQIISKNTNKEYPQNIFEIGRTFKINKQKETGVEETQVLGIAMCSAEADFTKAKQVLDILMSALNITYESKELNDKENNSFFIEGRVANIIINKKIIGIIGEIHPQIITNFGIEMPITIIELNVANLQI